jgi:glycosyltransferase involved in cell wall biosynthesis
LSVFTCAPNRGSETGVAWHWVLTIAKRGIALTVVTQERNRVAIEDWRAQDEEQRLRHVKFFYVSLFGDRRIPFGTAGHYAYYYIWQFAALFALLRSSAWRTTTLIHHLVYGGINAGSLLFLLPRPFMFGPMGGGETAPLALIRRFGVKPMLLEFVRRLFILASRINPVLLLMQWRATRILAKTSESARCMIAGGSRVAVAVEIGAPIVDKVPVGTREESGPFRILFAGRLIYWKGAEILADALLLLDRPGAKLEVTVIGTGARGKEVTVAFSRLQHIQAHVAGAVQQDQLFSIYRRSDLFVFPSLHDSSGNVVLEAMAFGLPVVCVDLGGPPILVGDCGVKVPARGISYDAVVAALAVAIRRLADDPAERRRLASLAAERARSITWDAVITEGYGQLLSALPHEARFSGADGGV